MKLSVVLVACTLVLGAAAVSDLPLVSWYECDPATCKPEDNCKCASMESPLSPEETPQFILYTHDDAILPEIVDAVTATVGDRTNPNGCTIPLTWFTIKFGTEPHCNLVKQLWREGHEIALHTRDHVRLDAPLDEEKIYQMTSDLEWLNQTCGIPTDHMVGMRNPFLVNNPDTRKVQSETMGLLYDSTINEHWTADNLWPTSANGSARLWPYSMDSGIPQRCDAVTDGTCSQDERYPGFWEVPVWVLQTSKYPMDAYTMDPSGDVLALLKVNFDAAYAGNRAPVPIYMHAPWMVQAENQDYVSEFMDYALAKGKASGKDDVWFVTMHQLIDWMRNPIPASEMKAKFNAGCKAGGADSVAAASLDVTPLTPYVAAPAPSEESTPEPAPAAAPAAAPSPSAAKPASSPPPAAKPSPSPVPSRSSTAPTPAPTAAPSSAAGATAPATLVGALLAVVALAFLL